MVFLKNILLTYFQYANFFKMSYLYIHNPERTFSRDELVQNSFLQIKILEFCFFFFL